MKAAINLEFTDDELRKYAEDVGRRWAMNFFTEAFKTGKRLKMSPGVLSELGQALASALSASGAKAVQIPPPPPSVAEVERTLTQCERVEACEHIDEGWICHRCDTYNGVHRPTCRLCSHERCDLVVPPPPSHRHTDPSVQ